MASSPALVVHTDGTPALRAFPWTNGIILAENRREYLEEAFKESRQQKGLLDMALVSSIV
jgi:hypothetical protein